MRAKKQKPAVYERWVIVGDNGLYVGQWIRREDAIAQHVEDLDGVEQHLTDHMSNYKRRCCWQVRRKNGDRCVKASITIVEG